MSASTVRNFLVQRAEMGDKYIFLPVPQPDLLRCKMINCLACRLKRSRTNVVFGEGSTKARLLVVGEAPGYNEDKSGRPFVGEAGQVLGEVLSHLGFKREDAFITNLVKCRPPGNRDPYPDEILACASYLEAQIAMIRPAVLVSLGRHAAGHLLKNKASINTIRGRVYQVGEYQLVPTFHPAYVLRNPALRRYLLDDLRSALRLAEKGKTPAPR